MAIEIVFDNEDKQLKRSQGLPSAYAPNTGNPIELSPAQIAEGWSRFASLNVEALRSAAAAISNP